MKEFRSGFVNIIGFPNVGKSTLLNKISEENLSITSPKVQTTRQRILSIITTESYQIIMSDTPGILNPEYELQRFMLSEIEEAFEDADIFLYLVEAKDKIERHLEWINKIKLASVPCFLIINKIDLSDESSLKAKIDEWAKYFPLDYIYPVSALYFKDLNDLKQKIAGLLPVHEPYFPEDEITDKTERFIAAEKIREQCFYLYQQEIPYAIEVEVTSFKDETNLLRIHADIIISRRSQKHIIIGKNGLKLKELGTAARKEMEAFFGKHIYLELYVKVKEDWQNKKTSLKQLGYRLP